MKRLDFRSASLDRRTLRAAVPRAAVNLAAAVAAVTPVIEDVRSGGREAVLDYTERFDQVRPESISVSSERLAQALADLDPEVRSALEESIRRARLVHADQRREDVTTTVSSGAEVTERWLPVSRVGLYVPGGLAVYPSSVVMNVVPAQTAGVDQIAIASPPQKEFGGMPHPVVLAAAALLGVQEVYAMGGAQAIAAFAYGYDGEQDSLEPVDLITGPGNAYVAAAKSVVRNIVGIDAIAGTTEIAVLADAGADPFLVAADLVSQAEHDPAAASILVTDSEELADAVDLALVDRVAATKHTGRVTEALGGPQSAIIIVDDLDAGIAVINAYAGEHVEILTANARAVAARVTNAGALFIGPYSPVSLGDYCAGSNHVLPTSGTASFASGLGVQSFLKSTHIVNYSKSALREVADHVVTLSRAEDLPAHGEAVSARFEQEVS
ncbi:histidinol dehydrogenase [Saxibacter everestensis]|uniref:Histidinol dehydrogenase n=2 Tax=Saxibacter everestensis TaxID=2909229 RepID=A0ABY8QZ00_9MICO|nr:histidinol dehydrogenase [Brevibacteriaceae bacterium ZFBP1038]